MKTTAIQSILRHEAPVGENVTIEGWVRSRRSSKGGFSFVHVHDGSCFDTLQAVADGALPNYEDEIAEIGTGCAVRITGKLVAELANREEPSHNIGPFSPRRIL